MIRLRVAIVVCSFTWLAACGRPSGLPGMETIEPTRSPVAASSASPAENSTQTLPADGPKATASETPSPSLGQGSGQTPAMNKAIFSSPQVITRGEIHDLAASADGRWLAVASASGLYLHDAQTLDFERALLEDVWVSGVAFSQDSRMLAGFGGDWLQLLDLTSAKTIHQMQASVEKLDFTPDGKSLVGLESWDLTALLHIWDLSTWDERTVVFEVEDTSCSMAVSPDGKSVALGSEWGWVEVFDLESTARQAVLSERTEMPVTDLAYSPDGSLLAAADASADGRVRVWSVEGRKKVVEQYTSGYRSIDPCVAFSADGQRLLGGMGDLAVVWERSSGQQVGRLNGYASFLMDLEISPNGDRLAYATFNWPAFVYDLEQQDQPMVYSVPDYQAFNVAIVRQPGGKTHRIVRLSSRMTSRRWICTFPRMANCWPCGAWLAPGALPV